MRHMWVVSCGIITAIFTSPTAHAWDSTGHQVVARIAWDQMQPETRQAGIALLKAAPEDAGLRNLAPEGVGSLADRERAFFEKASTWADIVRDPRFPERRAKYHHSPWHYINYYWEQTGPSAKPKDREDLKPEPGNVVERLQRLRVSLADKTRDPGLRAIDLAWVLHLVGHIHQPLHTSARVGPVPRYNPRGYRHEGHSGTRCFVVL